MAVRGLIGRKLGMSRVFDEEGRSIPVTVLQCGPCPITQIKSEERDGYTAVQLGFGNDRKEKRTPKPLLGHLQKSGTGPLRVLKEFSVDTVEGLELGQQITVSALEGVAKVKVTGWTKGRGFAGLMKRHGFGGGKATHGSDHHRRAGTIGMHQWPGHVFKEHPMSGRYGNERRTVRSLDVVRIDADNNLIFVKGAVPGARNGFVFVQAN